LILPRATVTTARVSGKVRIFEHQTPEVACGSFRAVRRCKTARALQPNTFRSTGSRGGSVWQSFGVASSDAHPIRRRAAASLAVCIWPSRSEVVHMLVTCRRFLAAWLITSPLALILRERSSCWPREPMKTIFDRYTAPWHQAGMEPAKGGKRAVFVPVSFQSAHHS